MDNAIETMLGYRIDQTGILGYEFRSKEGKVVCSVLSSVIPSPPVRINGFGMTLCSEFDSESTIYTGLTRFVTDANAVSEQPYSKLVYLGGSQYMINDGILVNCGPEVDTFSRWGRKIAQIVRCISRDDVLYGVDSTVGEPYFEACFAENISTEEKNLILAFPMLRFAL